MAHFSEADLVAQVPSLRAFARLLTRNQTDADDLVQETLARAWLKREHYQPTGQLVNWLFTITRRLWLDIRRHRQVRSNLDFPFDPDLHVVLSPASQLESVAAAEADRVLRTIPPEQAETLMLFGVDGFSHEEIADRMKVPVGTVKSRLSRARDQVAWAFGSSLRPPRPSPSRRGGAPIVSAG